MSNNPTTIGVGLISVGWMGQLHSRAYSDVPVVYPELGIRTRLVIAADTNDERARFAQDVLGYENSTNDYNDVLNHPDVDVVSVCAPNFLHEEIGTAVARAGKSLWIEKPVGRSAEETESVVDAADAAEVVTAVGFNYRNAPAIEYARKIIAEGRLGRITNVRGAFFADYSAEPNGALSWRFIRGLAGSGVLGDLLGLYHNADLPTGLDGVSLFHAGIGAGEFLQFLQAANVVFYIFPPGAGTGGGNGVGGLNQTGDNRLGLHVSVVRLNGVDHCGALFILPGQLHAQLHVAAFHFVVYGFA